MRNPWVWALIVLVVLSLLGEIPWRNLACATTNVEPLPKKSSNRLFILLHGYEPNENRLASVAKALGSKGDVVRVAYPAGLVSNADPLEISKDLNRRLEEAIGGSDYTDIRLVAHSSGALIARRALLLGWRDEKVWAKRVTRVVLMAGMNRGWSADGLRPLDMPWSTRWGWRIGEWFGRLLGFGGFILDLKAGAPFVANLRLDWMREIYRREKLDSATHEKSIEVVQLLGDIDDIVSLADNEDLRVMGSGNYALLRVRGTGHGTIIDLSDQNMGAYRQDKLLLAAAGKFAVVQEQNESLPYTTDPKIKSIVFVLHGIRDLGEWSSRFETNIRASGQKDVAIESPRYGYLGMGPFLLPMVRDQYVRWFMDEYTETLARYPEVEANRIQFFGHSNGTYVLADALMNYEAMRVGRVVFAGSVVPKKFGWKKLIDDSRVERVRNYVGTRDWVVALFPRLFELWPFAMLKNNLGSAGFGGFDAGGGCRDQLPTATAKSPAVDNVCYIAGEHSAFEARVSEIVTFLLSGEPQTPAPDARSGIIPWLLSLPATVCVVWLVLLAIVSYVGVRVVSAAPSPTWVMLVLYLLVVIRTLQTM